MKNVKKCKYKPKYIILKCESESEELKIKINIAFLKDKWYNIIKIKISVKKTTI